MPAVAAALALAASSAATRPSTFFWFGQMMTQTLKAMISASHMPMPISRAEGCKRQRLDQLAIGPGEQQPVSTVKAAPQRK